MKSLIMLTLLCCFSTQVQAQSIWQRLGETQNCAEKIEVFFSDGVPYLWIVSSYGVKKLPSVDGRPFTETSETPLIFRYDISSDDYIAGDPVFEILVPSVEMSSLPRVKMSYSVGRARYSGKDSGYIGPRYSGRNDATETIECFVSK